MAMKGATFYVYENDKSLITAIKNGTVNCAVISVTNKSIKA